MATQLLKFIKAFGIFIYDMTETILLLIGFVFLAVSAFMFHIIIGYLSVGVLLTLLSLLIDYSKGGGKK